MAPGNNMRLLGPLLLLVPNYFLPASAQDYGKAPRLWSQMSNIERRNRIDQLKERLFFEIKDQGLGGGGSYGAPDIPSYNAPTQQPPTYNQPVQQPPSYNQAQPSKPSYGAPPSYGGGGKGGKIIEIPIPDLPIPDPIQFKAGVLRSKGRIASGLLHTKAGILRAGANILAQKANALDKFAQAIPAIKANLINTMTGFGKGGGGGGYGAPPSNTYGTPPQAPPQPSYNRPQPQQQQPPIGPTQSSYNSNSGGSTFNSGNSFVNSVQPSSGSQSFRPSNQDSYGSPQGDVITGAGITTITSPNTNVAVGSSLSFGSNNNNGQSSYSNGNSFNNGGSITGTVQTSVDSFRNGDGFNPLVQSTLDQASNGKRNVFSGSGQIRPGQTTSITLNDINNFRGGEKLVLQESRGQPLGTCQSDFLLRDLLQDIFMGNEVIPDIIDHAPRYPLDLTYKTIRTFPGMRLTADMTRFKPMLKWPAQPDSLYTIVLSNLDINSRRNRTLSEFWHWFVANVPGDSVDDGEVIFDLLFPLVLPEGDGDHRYGYFVFEQPGQMDYREEGGPTDSCSPNMSNGRGPFKSTKNFMKKYNLDLVAATFIILDSNEASMQIACEWQKCIGDTINLVSPLQCG